MKPRLALLLLLLPLDTTRLPAAEPATGDAPPALRDAVRLFEQAVAADELRGAVLLVAHRGEVVLHEAVGWRDRDGGLPMTKDTLFHVASNTKPVVAAAVLMLAEEGKVDLDAEVGRYLPAFANDRCRGVRVRHLLTHTSGFRIPTIFLTPLLEKAGLRAEADRFAAVGAEVPPGTSYRYSNPGYNILGALVEVVSGLPLEEFLASRLYGPLGMADTAHRDLPGRVGRRACITARKDGAWKVTYRPGDPPRYPFVRASGGLITSAADYARFLHLFAGGGVLDGRRLLKAETVRQATSPLTREVYPPEERRRQAPFYGHGWQVWPDGSYGHGGSDGTFAWVDPRNELLGIVFTQSPGGRNPREEFRRRVTLALGRPGPAAAVGHRGLIHHAPENTLAGFAACLELRLGFEVDVRRSRDGHLVCVHDDDVRRTTDGRGKVAELTLAELRKLDAGGWFDPAFAGDRAPTLEEVLALVKERGAGSPLVALDLKAAGVEADVVRLAKRHGVLGQVVCIGTAVGDPAVRRKLKEADPAVPVAALAQTADDLPAALADADADWAYLRFVPNAEQVTRAHRAGKRVFVVGPAVSGREPDSWRRARAAGADAVLTDYPLEFRATSRE